MSESDQLRAVLANVDNAGLYHLPHMDKRQVVAAAKAAGLAAFRIDLAKVADKKDLLTAVAKAMQFPNWFGHNFDALADCLADMAWTPADGYVVLLEHCDGIHGKAEDDFLGALQVFAQAANEWKEQGVPFWCLVEMQADGIAWLPTEP